MNSGNSPLFRLWRGAAVAGALILALASHAVVAGTAAPVEQTGSGTNCASTHTVSAGETLTGLAVSKGVSLSALAEANNLSTTDQVLIGQQLCIPHTISAASPVDQSSPTPVQRAGTAATWTGKYYNNGDLSGDPVLTRQDAAIGFDWQSGSPDTTINNDSFSVSWSASVAFSAGNYRFTAVADDGVRIYVDNVLLLEDWNVHPATTTVGETELTEGSHTVRVEYFEGDGMASITVSWEQVVEETPDCSIQPDDSLRSFWDHSSLGCASSAAETVWAAWQPFETGSMVWRKNDGAVFVYADDGNWNRYEDDWNDQDLSNSRGTPPAGLKSPERGFGYLWETNDNVFGDLGWATDSEKGFCARIQQFDNGLLLAGDSTQTCQENSHNFASDTMFATNVLQALTTGTWNMVCGTQTHGRLQPYWNQTDLGCPLASGSTLWSAWQPFQQGNMLWQQNDDAVIVFDDDGDWARHSDDWDSQTYTNTRGTTPAGMQVPVRGFGYLWATDDSVYADLGWATEVEKGLCVLTQSFEEGTLFAGDPVDSCFENSENLVADTYLGSNTVQTLDAGTWKTVCEIEVHEELDHLWNHADYGCPQSTGETLWASWQPFQKGHMILRENDDAVFVFENGATAARHNDDWDDQEYTSVRGTPPEGLQAPVNGFGYLWENEDDVYDGLGWATAGERGFCASFQQFETGYLLVSDSSSTATCREGHNNEATEIDFALHSLSALTDGTWTLK